MHALWRKIKTIWVTIIRRETMTRRSHSILQNCSQVGWGSILAKNKQVDSINGPESNLRGYSLKFFKEGRINSVARLNLFSDKVINDCNNKFVEETVHAKSVNSFKNLIDKRVFKL